MKTVVGHLYPSLSSRHLSLCYPILLPHFVTSLDGASDVSLSTVAFLLLMIVLPPLSSILPLVLLLLTCLLAFSFKASEVGNEVDRHKNEQHENKEHDKAVDMKLRERTDKVNEKIE